MKLKNILTEDNNWRVKDIIQMQKAHERVLKAVVVMEKAVKNLEKISSKNSNKQNGKMFHRHSIFMTNEFERHILNTSSKFWKDYEEYRKGGRAAFPNDWNQ